MYWSTNNNSINLNGRLCNTSRSLQKSHCAAQAGARNKLDEDEG